MYIQQITLINHGLTDVVLHLNNDGDPLSGWVVITGDNGAGKSYLLRNIAQCLYAKTANCSSGNNSVGVCTDSRAFESHIAVLLCSVVEHIPSFPAVFYSLENSAEIVAWLAYLQRKLDEQRSTTQTEKQIATLLQLLNDHYLPPAWHAARLDEHGLWLGNAGGHFMLWTEAGNGIRSAMSLLLTILRAVFPVLEQGIDAKGFDVSAAAGIVLIDDIEMFLHPAWQRQIGFWLVAHFPHVQFIVSTHSPLICQAAQQIFVMSSAKLECATIYSLPAKELSKIQTSRPDTILRTTVFGLDNTRSPLAVAARADYAKLQSRKAAGVALSAEQCVREMQWLRFVENGEDG